MAKSKQTQKKIGSVISIRLTSKAGATEHIIEKYNSLADQSGTMIKAFKLLCRLEDLISQGFVGPEVLQMYKELEFETIKMKYIDSNSNEGVVLTNGSYNKDSDTISNDAIKRPRKAKESSVRAIHEPKLQLVNIEEKINDETDFTTKITEQIKNEVDDNVRTSKKVVKKRSFGPSRTY